MRLSYFPILTLAALLIAPISSAQQCRMIEAGECYSAADEVPPPAEITGDVLRTYAVPVEAIIPVGLVDTDDGTGTPFVLTDINPQQLIRMDNSGGSAVATSISANTGNPIGVGYDGTNFYVGDTSGQEIDIYDGSFVYISSFTVAGQTTFPEGITYNSNTGNLYVVSGDGFVHEYQIDGTYVQSLPLNGTSQDGIVYHAPTDQYFIYDSGTDMVRIYDGTFTETLAFPGTANAGFALGEGVALDVQTGELHVVATGSLTVVVFDVIDVIPVELLSFTATTNGMAVDLAWETSSETNNSGFEVQLKAGESWNTLAFVEGHGTTTEAQVYTHTATGIGVGTHVFRLKQIDFDGAFEYSEEVEATIEVVGTHLLTAAYPNPFNPQAQFSFAPAQSQHVTATLFNALGQRIATLFDGQVEANTTQQVQIDGAGLASGLYVVRVEGERFADVLRVTLMK